MAHGCKAGWHGCGSDVALPAPTWLLQHHRPSTVPSKMVLTWSPLPFRDVLFGFSYLLAIFHSPLPRAALSGTHGIWKGMGTQWSLQRSCTWLLTPLVQGDAHKASITTTLCEEKNGMYNPHVWLRKGDSRDNSCSWWIPSPCFCLAIFKFGISLIIQVRSDLGQLWWIFSKSSSLDSYCKRLPDDTMWSWNRLELCDDRIKSQWEPLPRSWDQFLM